MDSYVQLHTRVKLLGGCRCRPYSNYWGDISLIPSGFRHLWLRIIRNGVAVKAAKYESGIIHAEALHSHIFQPMWNIPDTSILDHFTKHEILTDNTIEDRVANGRTSSGPNPKTNLKPKLRPKKTKVKLGLKNLAMVPSYADYIFVHLRQKARLKPEILSTLGPNPTRKPLPDLQLWLKRTPNLETKYLRSNNWQKAKVR